MFLQLSYRYCASLTLILAYTPSINIVFAYDTLHLNQERAKEPHTGINTRSRRSSWLIPEAQRINCRSVWSMQ